MIVEFRVLAVSKETAHYNTDLLIGLFGSDHPMLDAVDNLPITATLNILSYTDWVPISEKPTITDEWMLIPHIKEKS